MSLNIVGSALRGSHLIIAIALFHQEIQSSSVHHSASNSTTLKRHIFRNRHYVRMKTKTNEFYFIYID